MAKICLCLTGKTIEKNLEILRKYQKYADLVELRVDCLDPDERLHIRRFPEIAGIPAILTIRREAEGGFFTGGEGSRISLFSKGLTFADVDPRRNFAYVDFEDYLQVPSLEEAARTCGTRIIRSYHNMSGVDENLLERLAGLSRVGDELVKVAVTPKTMEDVLRVFKVGRETKNMDKILICMGHLGIPTRILAELIGSQLCYTSVWNEPDMPDMGVGHIGPQELSERYRFRSITAKTRIFGIIGYPLKVTSSPPLFNTLFRLQNMDAVYVPFPTDAVEPFLELAEILKAEGISVTVPHKETITRHLVESSERVQSIGACNTMVKTPQGWKGYNTDAGGFSDSLLHFIGKKSLMNKRITIIGAGGVARAVAAEVSRLHGKALILNRTPFRARDLADKYRFAWGSTTDLTSIKTMEKYADILIQTTSAGMEGHADGEHTKDGIDPIESYRFTGHEVVMDIIYKPERTPFLKRAQEAGCRILNGYDMLMRQAKLQYEYFLNAEFPEHLMENIKL
jgi:3-dehydroquinate dehydratase/shikimate dehydrogenase